LKICSLLLSIIIVIVVFAFSASAQVSVLFGITSNIGTSVDRIGIFCMPQFYNSHIQCNVRAGLTYNMKSYGTKFRGPELQIGVAVLVPVGPKDSTKVLSNDLFTNKTNRKYSFAYAYNRYFDKAGTSQASGIVGFQSNRFRVITENDILGQGHSDRYRTAAGILSYIGDSYIYSIKSVLWTGDSFDPCAYKVTNDTIYYSRFGYKNLSDAKWGRKSLGILCFQVEKSYTIESPQTIKAMIGIDAEQVRQALQNRFIHDLFFLPKCMIGYKNMHYPMLQEDGTPYLHRYGQKVRKPKPFFNIGLNDNLFY